MTKYDFPSYLRNHATWWERLVCRLTGHYLPRYQWHPLDEPEDAAPYCHRCGWEPTK